VDNYDSTSLGQKNHVAVSERQTLNRLCGITTCPLYNFVIWQRSVTLILFRLLQHFLIQ